MTAPVSLPRKGEAEPAVNPAVDTCADCGDFLAWCPVWVRRFPTFESFRDSDREDGQP